MVMFHVAKPANQGSTAYRSQGQQQFGGSLWTIGKVSHHQHGPFIADQL